MDNSVTPDYQKGLLEELEDIWSRASRLAEQERSAMTQGVLQEAPLFFDVLLYSKDIMIPPPLQQQGIEVLEDIMTRASRLAEQEWAAMTQGVLQEAWLIFDRLYDRQGVANV